MYHQQLLIEQIPIDNGILDKSLGHPFVSQKALCLHRLLLADLNIS